MKKVLSVVLALVMLVSVVSVSVIAAPVTESDCTMYIGETRTVSLPGSVFEEYVIVRFVAPGSGKIAISSSTESSYDNNPVLEVFKDEVKTANSLGVVENNAEMENNFYYELNCEPLQLYFFVMKNSMNATSWNVTITCLHEKYEGGICLTCLQTCDHVQVDNVVGCCPCGDAYNGMEIKDGDEFVLEAGKGYTWFRFDADETVPYILASDNTDDESTWFKGTADPKYVIYNECGEQLLASGDDISEDNKNFRDTFLFENGERYFIGVCVADDNADKWTFTFNKGGFHTVEVVAEDGTVTSEEHRLEYVPAKAETCKEEGYTNGIYCPTCDTYIEGHQIIAVAPECKDEDANNKCDWCGRTMVEEEPVQCSHMCHSDSGFLKAIWKIVNSINKLFRLYSVCDCGVRHYDL